MRWLILSLALAACAKDRPVAPDTIAPEPDTAIEPDTSADVAPEIEELADTTPAPRLDPAAFAIEPTPAELMVYRSTPVALKVKALTGDLPTDLTCRWRMGDGTPEITGCEVEHVFVGGSADARIGVSLEVPGEAVSLTRIIPLERLEVMKRADPTDTTLPPPPDGPSSFRAVFVSDTAELEGEALPALADAVSALSPHLVIHQGGLADPNDTSSWTTFRDGFVERLRSRGIPLLIAPSPNDLAEGGEIRRPLDSRGEPLELIDGEGFPARYALSFRGVFFAIVSGAEQDHGSDNGLKWLRTRLAEAQVYESRLVLSHLPLHPFSAVKTELIGPRFKLYELLHRGRVTALVSAASRAFFKGRYGALSVLSVGSAKAGTVLSGHDHEQPASIALIDFENGSPSRVFSLVSRGDALFSELFDETRLPETVEVYTR